MIILRLLRRPERYTFPSTEIRIWLALTLLKKKAKIVRFSGLKGVNVPYSFPRKT